MQKELSPNRLENPFKPLLMVGWIGQIKENIKVLVGMKILVKSVAIVSYIMKFVFACLESFPYIIHISIEI